MIENPAAVAFHHEGRNQMYVFVAGDRGGLQDRFWNAATQNWEWDNRGSIPGNVALASSPSPVTSRRDDRAPEGSMHIFARGNDDALYECYWDADHWERWVNRGMPHDPDTTVETRPAVASLLARIEGDEPLFYYEVFVFVWSQDKLFRYSRHFGRWYAQPNVPQLVWSEPAAIREDVGANTYAALCYMVGGDGNLYVHFSIDGQGLQWESRDLGRPGPGVGLAALRRPGLGQLGQFRAIVLGEDSNLWAHSWRGRIDGTQGHWSLLGRPPNGAAVASEVSPVVFTYEGIDYIYNFFRGNNGHLYVARWDGQNNLIWNDFGRPTTGGDNLPAAPDGGNIAIESAPSAIWFDDQADGLTKMYAFVKAGDNHLHVCFWDANANTWKWNDLGPDPQD
jgi:hypothetical protein